MPAPAAARTPTASVEGWQDGRSKVVGCRAGKWKAGGAEKGGLHHITESVAARRRSDSLKTQSNPMSPHAARSSRGHQPTCVCMTTVPALLSILALSRALLQGRGGGRRAVSGVV